MLRLYFPLLHHRTFHRRLVFFQFYIFPLSCQIDRYHLSIPWVIRYIDFHLIPLETSAMNQSDENHIESIYKFRPSQPASMFLCLWFWFLRSVSCQI